MTSRRPCPPAPGPLEPYAQRFDSLFSSLAQRRGFRDYLQGLLLPAVLVFIVLLVNDERLMGRHRNGTRRNVLAWGAVGRVVARDVVLLLSAALEALG